MSRSESGRAVPPARLPWTNANTAPARRSASTTGAARSAGMASSTTASVPLLGAAEPRVDAGGTLCGPLGAITFPGSPLAGADWGRGAPLAHARRRYLAYGPGRCPEDGGRRPPGGSPHAARAPDRAGRGGPRGHGGRRAGGVRPAVRPDQRDHQRSVVRADRRGGGGRLAGAGRRPGWLRPAGAGRRRRGVPAGHPRDADPGGRRGHRELPAQDRPGPGVRGDRADRWAGCCCWPGGWCCAVGWWRSG